MKSIFKPLSLLVLVTTTAGCGTNFFSASYFKEEICFNDKGATIKCGSNLADTPFINVNDADVDPTLFHSKTNFAVLNEYVEQMAMKLSADLQVGNMAHAITVTSFASIDPSSYNNSALGKQIAESFIGELRAVGLPVNDINVTGMIELSPLGVSSLSRNSKELKEIDNVGYILTGTMVKNDKGVIINARIIGSMANNGVIASTSKLIPNLILSKL